MPTCPCGNHVPIHKHPSQQRIYCSFNCAQGFRPRRKTVKPSDPEALKKWCKAQVRAAIRRGELEPVYTCQGCGDPNKETQAHHPDYNKPFEVLWLCSKCHAKADKERRCKQEFMSLR